MWNWAERTGEPWNGRPSRLTNVGAFQAQMTPLSLRDRQIPLGSRCVSCMISF